MEQETQYVEAQQHAVGDVITANEMREMSLLELYYYQKLLGCSTLGQRGLSFLLSAQATGVAVLMTAKDREGGPKFVNDPDNAQHAAIKPKDCPEMVNIAHFTQKSKDIAKLYQLVTAKFGGTKGVRTINLPGFTSEQQGSESADDIMMAEERAWSYAKGVVIGILEWIESQFCEWDIIPDPMMPLSVVALAKKLDDDIADDEYWSNLLDAEIAAEREKFQTTLDAEKDEGGDAGG